MQSNNDKIIRRYEFLPRKQNKRKQTNKKHRVGGIIWYNGYVCLDIDCLKKGIHFSDLVILLVIFDNIINLLIWFDM